MASPPKSSSKSSSFDAFSRVDELVSKPVLGSDGAASWQSFRKDNHRVSNAPKAPLKRADKLATGFSTWEEERAHEDKVRKAAGHVGANAGYTQFNNKPDDNKGMSKKQRAQIEGRIRPDDKDYFIPAKTFEGWKFDYVFTTRNRPDAVGYYWDGMDSLKQLRGELKGTPATATISKEGTASGESDAITKRTNDLDPNKPKKKRKKKKGPVIVNDPNNPIEQVQAILQRRQNQQWMPGTATDQNLPAGWEAANYPSTGKTYYFHRATGKRSWEKPDTSPSDTEGSKEGEALPAGWKSAVDAASGKTYYHHTSGETTWTKPK